MIQVNGLTKRYGGITAVDAISFTLRDGETVGFLGPNGAGKSTTMKILTGYMPATSGTAMVAGFDVFREPDEVKRRVGYLPEHPPLYPEMSVVEYLTFVARIKEVPAAHRISRIDAVMDQTGLADVGGRTVGNLSRGYQQRVGLAQALVHDPPVLVLDEPTVGLDPNQIREVRALIRELGRHRTVILSTHILPEVSMICERILIVNRGRIVADGREEDLCRPTGLAGATLVRAKGPPAAIEALLRELPGVSAVEIDDADPAVPAFRVRTADGAEIRDELSARLAARGFSLYELRPPANTSLEEVFARLTLTDHHVPEVTAVTP